MLWFQNFGTALSGKDELDTEMSLKVSLLGLRGLHERIGGGRTELVENFGVIGIER
jgi:hypothetical protein